MCLFILNYYQVKIYMDVIYIWSNIYINIITNYIDIFTSGPVSKVFGQMIIE